MSSYRIVVARYKEDINWILQLNQSQIDNVIVYDKSEQTPTDSAAAVAAVYSRLDAKNIISRKNIGREADTYLHYIIENYNDLPDSVVFLQGHPFDHFKYPKAARVPKIVPETFAAHLEKLLTAHPKHTTPLFAETYKEKWDLYKGLCLPFFWSRLFAGPSPETFFFAAGCQYYIPKSAILARPLQVYKHVHSLLISRTNYDYEELHSPELNYVPNPFEMSGWTFERLMSTLFCMPYPDLSTSPPTCKIGIVEVNPLLLTSRILVTGGAGFIGSNIVKQLLLEAADIPKYTVIVVDKLSSENLRDVLDRFPDRLFYICDDDIVDCANNPVLPYKVGYVDGIFHLTDIRPLL